MSVVGVFLWSGRNVGGRLCGLGLIMVVKVVWCVLAIKHQEKEAKATWSLNRAR